MLIAFEKVTFSITRRSKNSQVRHKKEKTNDSVFHIRSIINIIHFMGNPTQVKFLNLICLKAIIILILEIRVIL